MPKEAARLFLRVTDVRVERIQDMTESEAAKEGFEREYIDCDVSVSLAAKYLFEDYWDNAIIKEPDIPYYGWDANPFVWRIAFERISKEEAMK